MLEPVEITKFSVFPGGVLDKHEGAVASHGAYDQILEGPDPPADGRWLRPCSSFPGECGMGEGAGAMAANVG